MEKCETPPVPEWNLACPRQRCSCDHGRFRIEDKKAGCLDEVSRFLFGLDHPILAVMIGPQIHSDVKDPHYSSREQEIEGKERAVRLDLILRLGFVAVILVFAGIAALVR